MRSHFDQLPDHLPWAAQRYRRWLAHYYDLLIPEKASVLEIGCGNGDLLAQLKSRSVWGIDISEKQIRAARARVPHGEFFVQAGEEIQLNQTFDYLILSDTLNFASDIQCMLQALHRVATPRTRILLNLPSSLWRPIYGLATGLGLRTQHPQGSWITAADARNLLQLAGWEPIKFEPRILTPWAPFGLDYLLNRWIAPLLPWFCMSVFGIGRPAPSAAKPPSVSVVVPARNEAGNIESAVQRIPEMGSETEIIFIEGHSKDGTWEAIQKAGAANPHRRIKMLRQSGNGKGNAVREAFVASRGDILMILDADLTVPPEELPKFFHALASGRAEFANGVRLVYPMEKQAMRFLNLCANKFFSLAFSWLLGQTIKDTLCGTKVLWRADYELIAKNRNYFGDFDPFGDFDLIFGADKLNLKMTDIPIRYQDRSYGSTNIHRWSHGLLLLRMLLFSARKLKFI